MIYDRRPRNDRESRLRWAAQVVIPPDSCLRGSADDLSTYFYCLKQAPYGWAFNLLGKSRRGCERAKLGLTVPEELRETELYFCLDVQGMGDLNAVDIAQQVHQSILERGQRPPGAPGFLRLHGAGLAGLAGLKRRRLRDDLVVPAPLAYGGPRDSRRCFDGGCHLRLRRGARPEEG